MSILDAYTTAQLDELLDALAARARTRAVETPVPVLNAAGETLGPSLLASGRVTVDPGDTIASPWGNAVWDQSVQVFNSGTDLTAQWPSPHDGSMVFLLDSATYWTYRAGLWRQTLNSHALRAQRSTAFTFPATAGQLVNPFIFNNVIYDGEGNYNPSNGFYTCRVMGLYSVNASISVSMTAGGQSMNLQIMRNGSVIRLTNLIAGMASATILGVSDINAYSAGDTISVATSVSAASLGARLQNETTFSVAWLGPA